jgi:hypothetical protein
MSIITTYSGITEVSPEDLLIIADMSILGTPTRTVNAQMLVGGSTAPLALTTFGTSGDSTLINNVLNIPNYGSGTMSSWFVGGDGGFEVVDQDAVLFIGGTKLFMTPNVGAKSVTFNHNATTRADTTSAVSPGAAGTFTVIDSITQDATGHTTAVNVKTVTMPTAGGGAGDTTYDLTSAQSGSDVNVNLVGSDATTDTVKFVAGTGITLTDSGSNQITVAGTGGTVTTISGGTSTFITNTVTNPTTAPVITSTLSATGTPGATTFLRGDNTWAVPAGGGGGTTYDLASAQDGANVDITLTPSTGAVDTVQLTAGSGITLTDNGSNNITIDAAGGGSGLWTATGNDIYNNNSNAVVIGKTSAATDTTAALEVSGRVSQVGLGNSVYVGKFAGMNDDLGNASVGIGTEALKANISGTNIAIGFRALQSNTTGGTNIAIGRLALGANTTDGLNTAIGFESQQFATAQGNTSLGYASMYSLTTGGQNIAMGNQTLYDITTGGSNVAMGVNALHDTTTGSENVAIGYNASNKNVSGNRNVALGYLALTDNTSDENTAIGSRALDAKVGGTRNVAIGWESGTYYQSVAANQKNVLANDCIYIGARAFAQASGNTNEIIIGKEAIGNGSNTVTIGGSTTTETHLKGVVVLDGYTFATLPASPVVGMRTYITDSAFPTYYTNASGGGTYKVPVFYDGSNWLWA